MNTDMVVMWLFRTLVGGGGLLLIVWALAKRIGQPARRQRLAEMGIAAALMIAVLAFLPGWIPIALPLPQDLMRAASTPAEAPSADAAASTSPNTFARNVEDSGEGDSGCDFAAMPHLPFPDDTYLAGAHGPSYVFVPPNAENL